MHKIMTVLSFALEWRWHSKHYNILWGHWHTAGRGNTIASHHWNIWHTWHWKNTNVVSFVCFIHDCCWNLVPFFFFNSAFDILHFAFLSMTPVSRYVCQCRFQSVLEVWGARHFLLTQREASPQQGSKVWKKLTLVCLVVLALDI